MKRLFSLLAVVLVYASFAFSQRADLSGLKICIDPGHGGVNSNDRPLSPDPGTNYFESESNLKKANHLKALLQAKGAWVILTRDSVNTGTIYPNPDDPDEPSLVARVNLANQNNVNWFHSIHSNATGLASNTSTNYSMIMVREKVVAGGDAVYGPGTGQPQTPEAWAMADFLGPNIKDKMRTKSSLKVLDWTFYGGSNGGYTLGVLRGLIMPGELSEGEFHDYFPVTRLLMNSSYCKMEAYAIRDAFLTYFGVPADSLSIVAGIVSESGTGKMVDSVQVRLLPENIVYHGDLYHNGFYMFDGIVSGPHTVRFETPNHFVDSVQLNVTKGNPVFVDKSLESTVPPIIVSAIPSNNDSAFAASGQIQIAFSRIMDTASVRNAFSITPKVTGGLLWSTLNTVLTFKPDSVVLPFNTTFIIRIDSSARSQPTVRAINGYKLDGNGDGTPGDAYEVKFKTKPVDVWPPVVVSASPANASIAIATNSVINFTFDEALDPNSVNSTNIVVREVGSGNRQSTFQYSLANGHGAVNVFPQGGLKPGRSYQVRISGVTDLSGNAVPASTPLYAFSVAPLDLQAIPIEDFSSSVASWSQPGAASNTKGIDSASFVRDSLVTLSILPPTARSGRLTYYWNTKTATDWLLQEYLNGGAGRSVISNKIGTKLQAYVYGDGSGTLLRFAVDDSVDVLPAGTPQNHEVNQWIPINWVGWKLVEWNFETDTLGTWVGNGKLEGMLRFNSLQLKYPSGSKITSGTIYVAQLQVVKSTATAVEPIPGAVPVAFALEQNYPNPFNPSTNIEFRVSNLGFVSLKIFDVLGRDVATLVNEVRPAGVYRMRWDASSFPSGVYFYRLRAGDFVQTKKLVLTK
jgi:N-acetylmuramoyl-L-alanine amidase